MATQDTAHREVAAPHRTMMLDSFIGVTGTAGVEPTAGSEQRADAVLIKADERSQDLTHCLLTDCQCRSRLRMMALLSALRAPDLPFTTMSTAGNWC